MSLYPCQTHHSFKTQAGVHLLCLCLRARHTTVTRPRLVYMYCVYVTVPDIPQLPDQGWCTFTVFMSPWQTYHSYQTQAGVHLLCICLRARHTTVTRPRLVYIYCVYVSVPDIPQLQEPRWCTFMCICLQPRHTTVTRPRLVYIYCVYVSVLDIPQLP